MITKDISDVFGTCKYQNICICNAKSSYQNTSSEVFYIYDAGGLSQTPVQIVDEKESFQLSVKNVSRKVICLIKTDKCLLTEKVKKCDCIVTDNTKVFLIEIKNTSQGSRSKRRRDAVEQLEATINLFNSHGITLNSYETTALICFKSVEPRIVQASKNSSRFVFENKYGVSLMEGNAIFF